ncbi:sporulation protein YabP [Anaerosacchariphilus polymeriproducens]|uniref:Sporulation protein YabP n=1 Tax=Anaerosacchariphilus polymeriproducens TaxID=1812858 RepID=A0A371AY59_9FIRM|nr:sporulation protein YabP [Anaerosacchariphilus polymeriproducens]RDU24487.1 sporulation protein YabP [Anaerosacchariphilus polymeriproducens]
MEERLSQKSHKLVLNNRKSSNITGVSDVISFDLNVVLLETEQGILTIKGNDLHVNRLTLEKGEIDITGRVDSFTYSDANGYGKKEESFFGRLFK